MRFARFVWGLLGFSALTAVAAPWQPRRVELFFVEPGRPARLEWTIAGGAEASARQFLLRDYAGRVIGSGQARVGAEGASATVVFAPGFYEVDFPHAQQRFGVVALPARAGPPDSFFAVDGALSWLVRDDAIREGLIQAARRSGISMVRERLTWGAVHPAGDRWDWQGAVGFDTLRRTYQKHGVQVLEMAHDAPAWLGRIGKYPADLVRAADSWQAIAARWKSSWGAVEVWNEPDIFFGDNLPADQYVALVRALAFGLQNQLDGRPLVGGVVAHHNPEFLATAAENGLLDVIDAFSFHTYDRAVRMEELVGQYRTWLEASGRATLPIWITESGRPWKRGPGRPPTDQDTASALDITMKAVEARACGVARYFAFVYPYYDENENNFGMMGKEATPLRVMAAYVQAARRLAGAEYVGDLPLDDARVLRSRVFRQGATMLAVLYTGKPDPTCRVLLPPGVVWGTTAPPQRQDASQWQAEGIDGRVLAVDSQGSVPIPDGLVYARLDPAGASGRLKTATHASRLWALGRGKSPPRPAPPGLIARYEFDGRHVRPTSQGYRLRAGPPENLPFVVRFSNLADQPARITVRLELSAGTVQGPAERAVEIAPRGTADLRWELGLGSALGSRPWVEARMLGPPRPSSEPGAKPHGDAQKSVLLAVRLLRREASAGKARTAPLGRTEQAAPLAGMAVASTPGLHGGPGALGPKAWP